MQHARAHFVSGASVRSRLGKFEPLSFFMGKGTIWEPLYQFAVVRFLVSSWVAEGDNEGGPSHKGSKMKPSVRFLEPAS